MLGPEAYGQLDPDSQRQVAANRVAFEKQATACFLEAEQRKREHEIEAHKWRAERERAELEAQRRKAEMELSAKNLLLRLQMVDAGANPAMIDQVFPLPRG
jgi:hypothetical protein